MLRDCGSLDAGDLVIELGASCSAERADVRRALSERFPFLMVDELEDAGAAHRALVEALVAEHGNLVCACDLGQSIRRPATGGPRPRPLVHGAATRMPSRSSSTVPCGSAPTIAAGARRARRVGRPGRRRPNRPDPSSPDDGAELREQERGGGQVLALHAASAPRRRRRRARSSTCWRPARCDPRPSA